MLYCEKCNYLFDIRKNVPGSSETGHLFCGNCGNSHPLPNNSLIFQARHVASRSEEVDLKHVKYDLFQRRILNKCTNPKCASNSVGKTEVVIYRDQDFNSFYLCTTCEQKIESI